MEVKVWYANQIIVTDQAVENYDWVRTDGFGHALAAV